MTSLHTKPTSQSSATGQPANNLDLFKTGREFNMLLAIDNDDVAPAAIKVANALVARGARPSILRAVEVMAPPPGSDDAKVLYAHAILGEDLHHAMRESIRKLVIETLKHEVDWQIRSVGGHPAASILEAAEAQKAGLIVMGIHAHGSFSQAIGENTATGVMAKAGVPVMAIRPGLSGLPRKIMVAIDFGNASRRAAHIAANLAHPGGSIVLVHVAPKDWVIEQGDEGAELVHREGIQHAFQHLVEEISLDKMIRVETITRTGDPQTELIAAAEQIAPDIIAAASHRHHVLTRLLLGSATRKLAREGKWSLLVVPPTGNPHRVVGG